MEIRNWHMIDRIGNYYIKPFSQYRRNIALVTAEGWRKHSVHFVMEIDVTRSKELIKKYREKTNEKISFTGWIIKCLAQTLTEYKEFNAYRLGRKKIVYFDDVDIPLPVEKVIDGEYIPTAYILRKANEKTLKEISNEIRSVQKQATEGNRQVIGNHFTPLERFAFKAPMFIKKLLVLILRKNGLLRKKHMGTVGVTAIGMMGKFSGHVIPMGGTTSILVVLGGISKKPGIVDDKIAIRDYLQATMTVDHDLFDGSPIVRFIDRFTQLCEEGFALTDL